MDDNKKEKKLTTAQIHPHVTARGQVVQTFTEEYHRENYVDPQKMQQAKEMAYQKDGIAKKTIKDPFSGDTLHRDGRAAIRKYGIKKSTLHKSQTDHVIPLKTIHKNAKHNAFLTDEDIKQAANQSGNFREISQHLNQSKGGMTLKEYIKKHPELDKRVVRQMMKAHRQSSIKVQASLAKSTVKNVAKTGMAGAKNALIGAAPTLISETVKDIQKVKRGEMEVSDAVLELGKKAGTVIGSGAGIGIASKEIAHVINQHVDFEVTPAHIGAVFAGIVAVKNAVDKLTDENLDTGEALIQIAEDCLGMVISSIGYTIGSAAGPVGAVVCSAVLSYAYNAVVQRRREYSMSKKARIQSEAFLRYVQERSAQFRKEFAEYAKGTLEAYDGIIMETLGWIRRSIEEKDPDILFAGINKAGAAFGVAYQFKTFEEFDAFMSDEDSVLVF